MNRAPWAKISPPAYAAGHAAKTSRSALRAGRQPYWVSRRTPAQDRAGRYRASRGILVSEHLLIENGKSRQFLDRRRLRLVNRKQDALAWTELLKALVDQPSQRLALCPRRLDRHPTNDGPNSIDVTTGLFERSASAKRSHKPSEAESETTAHPRSLARRCSSRRRTVLPQPRFPVMSMSLPGAPGAIIEPFLEIFDDRLATDEHRRPLASRGLKGIWIHVGLLGLANLGNSYTNLYRVIPTADDKRAALLSPMAEKLGVCCSPGAEGSGIDLYVRRGGTSYHLTV